LIAPFICGIVFTEILDWEYDMSRFKVERSGKDGEAGITIIVEIPLLGFNDEEVIIVDFEGVISEDQILDGTIGPLLERLVYFFEACRLMGALGMGTGCTILQRKLEEARQEMLTVIQVADQTKDRPPG
jgi:hypothetical protein